MEKIKVSVSDVPKMMRFWDHEKNTEDPALLSPGSKKTAFWKCPDCGYAWSSAIATRYAAKPLCPCHELKRAVSRGYNDILTIAPEAAKYYDFETNAKNGIDIYALTVKSNKSVHWKCSVCGYEWDSTVENMYIGGFKCPCHETGKRIQPGYNDYLTILPDAAREYDFAKNEENGIDIYHEGIASEKIVAWKCPDCGREWTTSLTTRAKKNKTTGEYYFSPCPHYNTMKRKTDDVPPVSDVPSLMEFWDPENKEDPHTVLSNSAKPYLWKCKKCGYSWTGKPVNRIRRPAKCPCCDQNRVIREGVNDFLTAVPELKRWFLYEENKDIDYHNFGVTDDTVKLWWECPDCGFRFQSTVANRIIHNASGERAVRQCNKERTERIAQKSRKEQTNQTVRKCRNCGGFIPVAQVPSLMKFWSNRLNIGVSPNDVPSSSTTKVFWECPKCGYTWKQTPRLRKVQDGKCPYCDLHVALYPGHNDVLTLLPEIGDFFDKDDPTNEGIDLRTCSVGSKQTVSWKCPDCGHKWSTQIRHRIIKNEDGSPILLGCPKCGRRHFNDIDYSQRYPDLVPLYDEKTNGKPFSEITSYERVNMRLSWICDQCGNTYTAWLTNMVANYYSLNKCCPYCNGRRVDEAHSLAELYPEIAAMWSSENPMPANEAFPDGRMDRKWVCTTCHCGFIAKPYDMVRGLGCPYCTGRRTDPNRTSLKAKYPKIAKMLAPRNPITADRIHYTSTNAYYFTCPDCGRESMAKLNDVISGKYTCPYCNERKVIPETTSLKAKYPEIAAHWSDKNDRGPETVLPTSPMRFLWHCDECGNDYYDSPQDMVNGVGCPYCNERMVDPLRTSLQALYPDVAKYWSTEKNGRGPETVFPTSQLRYLWHCDECGCDFTAAVREMVNWGGCPYCNERMVDPLRTSLKAKHPEIAALWSDKNDRGPETVFPTSNMRFLWHCDDCGNDYSDSPQDMVNGAGCPYCNERMVDPLRTSLKAKYPEIAAHWSDKNDRGPETVFPNSKVNVLWHCDECGYDYTALVADVVAGESQCPYCNDTKVMPGFNSLKARHPELMDEWIFTTNTLLGVDPDAILDRSNKRVWWQCKNDPTHHYPMTVGNRLMFQKRHREPCPYCKGRRVKQHHFVTNKIRPK